MRTPRMGRTLLLSLVLALGVSTIVGAGVAVGGDEKGADPPRTEGSSKGTEEPGRYTVPARAADAPISCPSTYEPFVNPVLHVRFCVPAGWGFSAFTGTAPLKDVGSQLLDNLHLLSKGAFPWTVGALPFDVISDKGIVDVEFTILEREAGWSAECTPSTPRGSYLTCAQAYDALGLPAAVGPITAQKVIVPLRSVPSIDDPLFDALGARLLVVIRHRTGDIAGGEQAWRVVETIEAY